jgi:ribosomal protein L40E
MAVVTIGHHPELTIGYHPELTRQRAMEIFQKHYKGEHRVRTRKYLGRGPDFHICWNFWCEVWVRLKQGKGKTSFQVNATLTPTVQTIGCAPAIILAAGSIPVIIASAQTGTFPITLAVILTPVFIVAWLLMGVVARPHLSRLEADVKSFIENAPEFKVSPSRDNMRSFCRMCGHRLDPGVKFCRNCGASAS